MGFPGGSDGKESAYNVRDPGSTLWSPAGFDLPSSSSHLLSGEAGETKGQSNVSSSLVEPQLSPESCFLAAFTGAKINNLHVVVE